MSVRWSTGFPRDGPRPERYVTVQMVEPNLVMSSGERAGPMALGFNLAKCETLVFMEDPDEHSLGPLTRLAHAVDEDFAGILARQGARIKCQAGCSDCCRARLSITRVEEALLRQEVARLSLAERKELARRARDPKREMCPALDAGGRCQLYDGRPLICRSFGAPLRHRAEVVLVNPPVIDACSLNFVDVPLRSLPVRDVIEQTQLDGKLEAIDDAYCDRNGYARRERIGIAQILASLDSDD